MEAVLLIGIPASGKTSFYQQRFAATHAHVSLDVLKTRRREARLVADLLAEGRPFVVDNTNVQAAERARYIALARAAGFAVIGYYFPCRLQAALERNRARAGRIPERGLIARFYALQPPALAEGFDRLYQVTLAEAGQFVVAPVADRPAA
jgi:predicted kinase